jgi:hypothetical protein
MRAVRNTVSLECHRLHKYPCLYPVSIQMDDKFKHLDYTTSMSTRTKEATKNDLPALSSTCRMTRGDWWRQQLGHRSWKVKHTLMTDDVSQLGFEGVESAFGVGRKVGRYNDRWRHGVTNF